MKIGYTRLNGFTSTAYLDDGDGNTRTGQDKYTDEPITVRWNGDTWTEQPTTPADTRWNPDTMNHEPIPNRTRTQQKRLTRAQRGKRKR